MRGGDHDDRARGRVATPRRDGYSWYDAPLKELPEQFCLVVCDGPAGDTPGGRYGLVPVLGPRITSGCVILLDDAERAPEREALLRWSETLGGSPVLSAPDPTDQAGYQFASPTVP